MDVFPQSTSGIDLLFDSPPRSSTWTADPDEVSILLDGIIIDPGITIDEELVEDDRFTTYQTSNTISTIGTVGTFGPIHHRGSPWPVASTYLAVGNNNEPYQEKRMSQSISVHSLGHSLSATFSYDSSSSSSALARSPSPVPSPFRAVSPVPSIESLRTPRSRSPLHFEDGSPYSYCTPPTTPQRSSRRLSASSTSSDVSLVRQPRVSRHLRSPSPSPLHRDIAWLKGTVVQLVIDQESFRSIAPEFKFAGFSTKHDTGGIAEFMPIRRESFHFHYAPFEGLPVLRRLAVNGEESRDYITRQATLNIKTNGVYTVRGNEVSATATGIEGQNLKWKFDYIVDDRKPDSNAPRSQIEGEKTLTPLTFSCSTALLHHSQGKKIKLIHVMKKTVAVNLLSEKVEPPTSSRNVKENQPIIPSTPSTPMQYVKTHMLGFHRRALSYVPKQGNSVLLDAPKILKVDSKSNARRRRASSAGDPVQFQGVRHIMQPAKLTELMNQLAAMPPEPRPRVIQVPQLSENRATLVALSPAPRHHRTRT